MLRLLLLLALLLRGARPLQYLVYYQSVSDPYPGTDPELELSHVSFSDDAPLERVPLKFDFPFYVQSYNRVFLSPNGFLQFDAAPGCGLYFSDLSDRCLIDGIGYQNLVAGFLTDLDPTQCGESGNVSYISRSTEFTVYFRQIPLWGMNYTVSFSMSLFPSGDVTITYHSVPTRDVLQRVLPRPSFYISGMRPPKGLAIQTPEHTFQAESWETSFIGDYVLPINIQDRIRAHFYPVADRICTHPVYHSTAGGVMHFEGSLFYAPPFSFRCHFALTPDAVEVPATLDSDRRLTCAVPSIGTITLERTIDVVLHYVGQGSQLVLETYTKPMQIIYTNRESRPDACYGNSSCDSCGQCMGADLCRGCEGRLLAPTCNRYCSGDEEYHVNNETCVNGTRVDCLGVMDGNATAVWQNTTLICCTLKVDCAGVCGGAAVIDGCGVCSGGTTGKRYNENKDCQGVCFGENLPPCLATVTPASQNKSFILSSSDQSNVHALMPIEVVGNSVVIFDSVTLFPSDPPSIQLSILAQRNGSQVSILLPSLSEFSPSHYELNLTIMSSSYFRRQDRVYPSRRVVVGYKTYDRNHTGSFDLISPLRYRDCESVSSLVLCSGLPGCYVCVFSKNFNGMNGINWYTSLAPECRTGNNSQVCHSYGGASSGASEAVAAASVLSSLGETDMVRERSLSASPAEESSSSSSSSLSSSSPTRLPLLTPLVLLLLAVPPLVLLLMFA